MNLKPISSPRNAHQCVSPTKHQMPIPLVHPLGVLLAFVFCFLIASSQYVVAADSTRGFVQKQVAPKSEKTTNLKSTSAIKPTNQSSKNQTNAKGQKHLLLEGIAFAKTQSAADIQARNELENNLRAQIASSSSVCNPVNRQYLSVCETSRKKIITQAKLPLMGVNYQKITGGPGVKGSKASLIRHLALPAYQDALKKEMRDMEQMQVKEEARGIKKRRGIDLTTHMMRYYQLAAVAALLGEEDFVSKKFEVPDNKKKDGPNIIKVSSIDEAISKIARTFKIKAAYIYPPRPLESAEITPFGKAFYDRMVNEMPGKITTIQFGSESISSAYSMVDGDMLLSVYQYNRDYLLENRLILHLDKNAISKFRTAPVAADFDQLFVAKEVPKTGFYGQIVTQKGSEDLLFRKGDTIKLYVRLSKPGYFYVVGHIKRPGGEYSYLVDINEGEGPELFVTYVRPDQVNQVIDLGEFDVEPPYGVEYLQLVSATKDLKSQLPKYSYDEKLGYYVLDSSKGNVKAGVEEVRALKRIDKTILYHENQLVYTTMK